MEFPTFRVFHIPRKFILSVFQICKKVRQIKRSEGAYTTLNSICNMNLSASGIQNLFFHIMLSIGRLGCPLYLAFDF